MNPRSASSVDSTTVKWQAHKVSPTVAAAGSPGTGCAPDRAAIITTSLAEGNVIDARHQRDAEPKLQDKSRERDRER
ncbi:hypothetical protein OPV22_020985 [Ensete ventricosum]|uniref:Uncharacterized protein n=1 Tax=Ensete ventricosum TaxID=4639 RepID=A0AAV8QK62_ENSVE|nr:hypothetical protein OPV22_020985 [Ensete ventricosum]